MSDKVKRELSYNLSHRISLLN